MRQSVRCVALGVLSAVALAGAALPASAGLLDGGWGCGCGGPAYYVVPTYVAPPFIEPVPALIYPQVQVVVAPPRRLCAALRLRPAAPAVAPSLRPAPLLLSAVGAAAGLRPAVDTAAGARRAPRRGRPWTKRPVIPR